MSADWAIVRLGNYCSKIGSGSTPTGGSSVYLDQGEICLIRSQNIYNKGFKPNGLAFITEDAANKLKNVIVEKNDVLLNITGDSVARVCLAKEEFLPARVNQHVAIIRPDPNEFDPRYLRYFLASPTMQNFLLSIAAVGATRNALTKSMIESLEVSKPPITIQTAISDQLEVLDKKIHLNTQTNQTLEQIAQAIFKSWFVDFDPVKAKIAARNALTIQGLLLPSPFGRGAGGEGKKERKNTPPQLLENARNLRQSATDAENLLWKLLRNRQLENCKFRRQHPFARYILDFYCDEYLLVIELDGGQHNDITQKQYDEQRTAYLNQQGIQVLRFWNNEVLQQTEAVLDKIYQTIVQLQSPSPLAPLPKGEGNEEHPSITLAAMSVISGKNVEQLAQLQIQDADAYQQLAQTAALFPSAMQESELGEIPEGWSTKPLDGIAIYQNGLALQKFRPEDDRNYLPIVKIADLKKGIADHTEKASPDIKPTSVIDNGDVVFSWSGSLMVDIWCGGKAALNQHLFKVTSDQYPKWFFHLFTKLHLEEFQRIAAAKAVTMGHIKKEHLTQAICVVPCDDILLVGNKAIGSLIDKQIELRLENGLLTDLRDSLLPKLLSGEIDLSDE